MATYVLVHGGVHGGWLYRRVARILRQAGHDVRTPTLTGLGERAHPLSPDIDIDDIDIGIDSHSYCGTVVAGVADRATDRVGPRVHLDAATPVNGRSPAEVAARSMAVARGESRVIDAVELVLLPSTGPMAHCGVSDPDDIARLERSRLPTRTSASTSRRGRRTGRSCGRSRRPPSSAPWPAPTATRRGGNGPSRPAASGTSTPATT